MLFSFILSNILLTEQKKFDFMPYWKNEEKCFEEAKVEGKDTVQARRLQAFGHAILPKCNYNIWDGLRRSWTQIPASSTNNVIRMETSLKDTGPKQVIRQIVRIRTSDDKEWLYSNGYLIGFDVVGDPVCQSCSNPETWIKTGFQYKKEYDTEQGRVKSRIVGPNALTTVYEMPFNEKNLKELYDKRITPADLHINGPEATN